MCYHNPGPLCLPLPRRPSSPSPSSRPQEPSFFLPRSRLTSLACSPSCLSSLTKARLSPLASTLRHDKERVALRLNLPGHRFIDPDHRFSGAQSVVPRPAASLGILDLVRNANWAPVLVNQKLWEWGPLSCVLTRPPSGLRATALDQFSTTRSQERLLRSLLRRLVCACLLAAVDSRSLPHRPEGNRWLCSDHSPRCCACLLPRPCSAPCPWEASPFPTAVLSCHLYANASRRHVSNGQLFPRC